MFTPRRTLLVSLLAAWVALVVACGGAGQNADRADVNQKLAQADRLWESGDHAQAAARYEAIYREAYYREQKAPALVRLVAWEQEQGHEDKVVEWMRQGIHSEVPATYPPALEPLLARARQEEATAQAEDKRRRDEEFERAHRVSRVNYNKLRDGMSLEEVQRLLGPGREQAASGNMQVVVWQSDGLLATIISCTFADGRLTAKAISP